MKDTVDILEENIPSQMIYCVKHHQTPTGRLGACRFHVHNVLKALLQLSQPNSQGPKT